jgi:hypothetical protein
VEAMDRAIEADQELAFCLPDTSQPRESRDSQQRRVISR